MDLLNATMSDPTMRAIDADSGSIDADEFAEFVGRAVEAGALRPDVDPKAAAEALMDLWTGAVRSWMTDPGGLSLPKLFGSRVGVLLEGIAR